MFVTSIWGDGPRPLGEFRLACNRNVNLLIGPNASGKSTVLRATKEIFDIQKSADLTKHHLGWTSNSGWVRSRGLTGPGWTFAVEVNDDPSDDPTGFVQQSFIDWGTAPLLYVPSTRINLPVQDLFDQSIASATEIPLDDPAMDSLFDPRSNVFYGRAIEVAIRHPDEAAKGRLEEILRAGYSCAKDICPEVLRGSAPQYFSGLSSGSRIDLPGLGISINDSLFDPPLYAGALSSGSQGTLLWIWALAFTVGRYYSWGNEWTKRPAILLIDEIENHLHPTWQRRVIPALLEHFPGLQIFATTHSPFVVAGREKGQVHLLKRDENTGVVTATTHSDDIIGWTVDEISQAFMEVDEPTDPLTIKRTNRLQELRRKETLTTEEEIELNTLRRQVNESLLSREDSTQRESYADLMKRFLLTRQSDLNQEGG